MAIALDVRDLSVRFDTQHGNVQAVDHVSFSIEEGETLGLVGESGSGKSVSSLAVMGLVPSPPGVVEAEAIMLGDRDLNSFDAEALRRVRGKEVAMVFQDPMTSLNPLLTVGRQLTEVLEIHEGLSQAEAFKRAAHGLGDVGIPAPEERLNSYPHELSGGMRQRVMIAMALLCNPKVLIADEPTTALDVTIQAQILELMKDLQERHGTAILLITHGSTSCTQAGSWSRPTRPRSLTPPATPTPSDSSAASLTSRASQEMTSTRSRVSRRTSPSCRLAAPSRRAARGQPTPAVRPSPRPSSPRPVAAPPASRLRSSRRKEV